MFINLVWIGESNCRLAEMDIVLFTLNRIKIEVIYKRSLGFIIKIFDKPEMLKQHF